MKVKFANRIYDVLFTKELAGLTMYAVEDEPNHIDWLINVEVVDAEKKELKKIEQKPADTEKGANGNEREIPIPEPPLTIKHAKEVMGIKQNDAWSEEDEEIYRKCICAMRASACGFPEEEKFVEKVDNWLKSIKDRVQPKQGWSEEDEKCIRLSTDIIDSSLRAGFCVQLDRDRCVDWLKSLSPQPHWKPSEEQIQTLQYLCETSSHPNEKVIPTLESLYQDLKKLREE